MKWYEILMYLWPIIKELIELLKAKPQEVENAQAAIWNAVKTAHNPVEAFWTCAQNVPEWNEAVGKAFLNV